MTDKIVQSDTRGACIPWHVHLPSPIMLLASAVSLCRFCLIFPAWPPPAPTLHIPTPTLPPPTTVAVHFRPLVTGQPAHTGSGKLIRTDDTTEYTATSVCRTSRFDSQEVTLKRFDPHEVKGCFRRCELSNSAGPICTRRWWQCPADCNSCGDITSILFQAYTCIPACIDAGS
jgi:hypothetical protein